MENKFDLIKLYDRYSMFLTDKQKLYFENYYFEDLSYEEIANNLSVSKNAVFKQVKDASEKLIDIDNKIMNKKKKKDINEVLDEVKDLELKEKLRSLFFD